MTGIGKVREAWSRLWRADELELGLLGRVLLFAILGLGLALRLDLILRPMMDMAGTFLPDDAAFYLVVAKRLAAGQGLTWLDGLPATGVQPLWQLLITPVFWLAEGEIALRLVLLLALLCNLAAALVLFTLARRLARQAGFALLALLFYYLSPLLLFETINGLETSLADLLGLLFLLELLRARDGLIPWRPWRAGLFAGLAMLGRVDNLFLAGLGLCWALWALSVPARRLRDGLWAFGLATLAVLPWLVTVYALTGTPMPSSGNAYPFVLHENFRALHPSFWASFSHSLDRLLWALEFGLRQCLPLFRGAAAGTLLTLFLYLWLIVWARKGANARDERRGAWLLFVPFIAALCLLSVHGFIRWYPRSWYVQPMLSALALIVACGLAAAFRQEARRGWLFAVVLAFLVLSLSTFQTERQHGLYPWQKEDVAVGLRLKDDTTVTGPLAGFNIGWITYLSGREVHELGGVINSGAFPYLLAQDLEGYLSAHKVQYLVDCPYSFLDEYRRFFKESFALRLKEVERFDLNVRPWLSPHITLYRYSPTRPTEPLTPPFTLSLGQTEAPFVLSGFHPGERDAEGRSWRYTQGPLSRLGFYLDAEPSQTLVLSLRVKPFAPPESASWPDLMTELRLNGGLLGTLKITRKIPDFVDFSLEVGPDTLKRGFNTLELHFSDTHSPRQPEDLPAAKDNPYRQLGDLALAVQSLSIEPRRN